MNFARKSVSLAAFLLIAGSLLCAQKPRLTNAKVQEISASSGLRPAVDSLLKQAGPLWIGYRIPAAAKERTMCCFDSWSEHGSHGSCCGCRMEGDKEHSFSGTSDNCSSPEPLPYAFVFLRSEAQKIQKVRVFSPECPLDFAGLQVYWMEDVNPAQSVDLLTALVIASESETMGKKDPLRQSVMAIAMHNIAEADQALEKLMQPSHPPKIREDVAFWIGVERGKKGLEILRKYAKSDPDERVRDKLAFAFSQSKEPEAIQDLIGMARNDSSPHVRGQAIFWLAQIGGRKEAQQITDAIQNDPETEVKKKAVFALSQMPKDEGVPLLISVAKTNKNPVVRREAIRWLGFSNDPRALDFIEQILTK